MTRVHFVHTVAHLVRLGSGLPPVQVNPEWAAEALACHQTNDTKEDALACAADLLAEAGFIDMADPVHSLAERIALVNAAARS